MNDIFQQLNSKILECIDSNQKSIAIACSGGVDSMVLTYIISHFLKNYKIFGIIINHNLQKNSLEIANNTAQIIEQWNVKPIILHWNHEKITSGIEEKARNARYQLISKFAYQYNIKTIFLAHHIDDKIETFFLQSSRGVGLQGLCSMQEKTKLFGVTYVRPMLYLFTKKHIIQFAKHHNLAWFEDETNQDKSIKRNKIRMENNFSENEKHGFLTTIQNLNSHFQELTNDIKKIIAEEEVGVLKISKKIDFFSNTQIIIFLQIVFQMLFSFRQTEIRQFDVINFKNWLISDIKQKTFGGCIFTQNNDEIIIKPEWKRLKSCQINANEVIFWNNMCAFSTNKPCNINVFGEIIPSLKKKFDIKLPFSMIAHLPVFYDGKNILAIPHLNLYFDSTFVVKIYEN